MSTIDTVFYPGYQTEHSQMYSQAITSFARPLESKDCIYLVFELVERCCIGSMVYQEAFLEASILSFIQESSRPESIVVWKSMIFVLKTWL